MLSCSTYSGRARVSCLPGVVPGAAPPSYPHAQPLQSIADQEAEHLQSHAATSVTSDRTTKLRSARREAVSRTLLGPLCAALPPRVAAPLR